MGHLRGGRSGHRVAAIRAGHGAGHGRPPVAVHPEWRIRLAIRPCGRHDATTRRVSGAVGDLLPGEPLRERTQPDLPAPVRADRVAHRLPAVAVAVDVTVLELDPRTRRAVGDEPDLYLTRPGRVGLDLPLHRDVPTEDDPM